MGGFSPRHRRGEYTLSMASRGPQMTKDAARARRSSPKRPERVALRGAVARAAPPHGVVRLGQRRRVADERRERRADAGSRTAARCRRPRTCARAPPRRARRPRLRGLASPHAIDARHIRHRGRVDAFEGALNYVDAAPCPAPQPKLRREVAERALQRPRAGELPASASADDSRRTKPQPLARQRPRHAHARLDGAPRRRVGLVARVSPRPYLSRVERDDPRRRGPGRRASSSAARAPAASRLR